ncbi:hypothetical protein [Desulfatirhabdium butyrativorans]|uniref:hypothetical protein n=1 Tax=Desulfatirhabdium butyrativorans TaxID=340467 RepID=UPI0004819C74|nr:hypothetical protein [Desulfatirhabdium butyrativorans]
MSSGFGQPDDENRWNRHWDWYIASACVLAALCWLQWNSPIVPLAGAYDSEIYLRMARYMAEGRWLGPYDGMTLIRLPVYPAFVGKVVRLGLSLQNVQVVANLGAILVLALALRAAGLAAIRIFAVVLLAGFHPASWMPCRFVATEALAQALITIMMASAIGIAASIGRAGAARWAWAVLFCLGLSGAFWIREEGMWLLPFGLVLGWMMVAVRSGNGVGGSGQWAVGSRYLADFHPRGGDNEVISDWMQRLGFALIVGALGIVCLLAVRHWIITQNERHYGVAVTTEISEPEFRRAFRNLTRLDANRHHPYVPVTREAMAAAARVSPGFRELMPVLEEQLDGKGWSRYGCEWMGICREIAGGWMVWAFRDAADQVGKYVDARTARAFYSGIAEDIEAACSAGRIECSSNPTGNILAPPLQPVDAWRILFSCGRVLWMAVWMPGLGEGIAAVERLPSGPETTQAYRWLKGDRIDAEAAPLYLFGPQIVWVYRLVHIGSVLLIFLGLVYGVAGWFYRCRKRRAGLSTLQAAAVLCCAVIVSRTLLVAYIDAMSFWAQLRYMLSVYPALIVWMGCIRLPSIIRKYRRS